MAERITLQAEPRTVLGKKVSQLRRAGRLPGNVYGKGISSVAIEVDAREFGRSIKANGVRGMFELAIAGEKEPRHVIMRGLDRVGGTGDPMHVDFFQVDPSRPMLANVPIRLVGEAPAVRDLAGTLLQSIELISVRCLPLQIPDVLEVDVTPLRSFDLHLTVGDIAIPAGVEIVTDSSVVIATVNAPRIRLDVAEEPAAASTAESED